MFDPDPRSQGECPLEAQDFAMMAHDVRSALHGVTGGVALIDGTTLEPATRVQIERIGAACKMLSHLVCDLLGDRDPDVLRPRMEPVDVAHFVRHISQRWSGEAEELGVALEIDLAPEANGVLRADRVALGRALGNLVSNALRTGDVRLSVACEGQGGLCFAVQDRGPGIPTDVLDAVFSHDASRSQGLLKKRGLGLHIVRQLCTDLGARLHLRNLESGGAEGRISFPPACFSAGPARVSTVQTGRIDLAGLHILLAEDNPTNQIVATQMLHALNAEVTLCSDGIEALEKFELGDFDLVVVDIEMPRMTGLDVIRTIRARSDARARVPIVALTAYAMRAHRDRIAAAGADGLISKPITSVEALGEALRLHVSPNRVRTAATVSLADDPVADLAVFDALCAAIGPGMMEELLDKVVADLSQARGELEGALSPLDCKPILSSSHILISVAGAIGAVRLQACARALNTAAHAEDSRSLPGGVRACLAEIDTAIVFANSRRKAA